MKKTLVTIILLIIFCSLFFACTENRGHFLDEVDFSDRKYTEITLTDKEKVAYTRAKILYSAVSENYQYFLVEAFYGYHGTIKMAILTKDKIIINLKGVDITEEGEKGLKPFDEENLNQYIGKNLSLELLNYKGTPYEQGDIMIVTMSTVTSKGILDCVNAVATYFINNN